MLVPEPHTKQPDCDDKRQKPDRGKTGGTDLGGRKGREGRQKREGKTSWRFSINPKGPWSDL